ncbi:Hypothetical protein CINCED_3A017383 [Cinara cedri]|uniref:Uncharacterized protein n=1 Tax=Cinara cedri TaxID=506608 RepID=A0A5E4MPR0_9HEMI|nr:Hypothetical protein CINCED_3A017383 [Cinara cedri]
MIYGTDGPEEEEVVCTFLREKKIQIKNISVATNAILTEMVEQTRKSESAELKSRGERGRGARIWRHPSVVTTREKRARAPPGWVRLVSPRNRHKTRSLPKKARLNNWSKGTRYTEEDDQKEATQEWDGNPESSFSRLPLLLRVLAATRWRIIDDTAP